MRLADSQDPTVLVVPGLVGWVHLFGQLPHEVVEFIHHQRGSSLRIGNLSATYITLASTYINDTVTSTLAAVLTTMHNSAQQKAAVSRVAPLYLHMYRHSLATATVYLCVTPRCSKGLRPLSYQASSD